MHVHNANGVEVALIHQKVLALTPKYFIEIPGQDECELVGEFKLLKQSYRLEGGPPWHLEGNFLEHKYTLSDNGRTVMSIARKWFSWGDSYELDIPNPDDELMSLCIALIIDCIIDQERETEFAAAASEIARRNKAHT